MTRIKSSKLSLQFANTGKLEQLCEFIDEYSKVIKQFIDILWDLPKIPNKLDKKLTDQITDTWLSARAIQAAGLQASGIVRGTQIKQKKRLFVYNKLIAEGKLKQAHKLKRIIDAVSISKPNVENIEPQLDQRFIKQDWDNPTTYDGMITISSLGNKLKIILPVKRTKHFNKLFAQGQLKVGIRILKSNITFAFELPVKPKQNQGLTVGLDVGVKNAYTMSNGAASRPDAHGHTLDTINDKLTRKRSGSKAFARAQAHRDNYINWSINQIQLQGIQTLKLERIKHLRKGSRTSRKLARFTYTKIFSKLEDLCITNGVQIEYINPTYTSQRCSKCGWVRKVNRNGKQFKCRSCGYSQDADLNAAINISLPLRPIGRAERLKHRNSKGFYWNVLGEERIVPSAQKP